jgi:hypothetical protein
MRHVIATWVVVAVAVVLVAVCVVFALLQN